MIDLSVQIALSREEADWLRRLTSQPQPNETLPEKEMRLELFQNLDRYFTVPVKPR